MSLRLTRLAPLVVAAAAALLSSACFSSQTVIKLHPDGAGTIEQTNLVNTAAIGMAAGMAKSMAGDNAKGGEQIPNTDDLFSEEQMRKQASQFGEGVRFVSSEKVTQGGMQGARAIYAFDKVETLAVGKSRGGASMDGAPPTSGAAAPPMQFALTKSGSTLSRLTISFAEPKADAAPADAAPVPGKGMPDIPPEALAMVRSMFEGARLLVEVEVDGRIIKTNAPATNGARATLVEVDFGQLLADPSKFQALQSLRPGADIATIRKALADAKGVKIPLTSPVTIDFTK